MAKTGKLQRAGKKPRATQRQAGCGSRDYDNITDEQMRVMVQQLATSGASVTGNNPWDVNTHRNGVRLLGEWDKNSLTLRVTVTKKDWWVPCDAIWDRLDAFIPHVRSLDVRQDVPVSAYGVSPELTVDTGYCDTGWWGGEEKQDIKSYVLPPRMMLNDRVNFNDAGLDARYKGQVANGIVITAWSSNAGDYTDPGDGYIEVSYGFEAAPGIPGEVRVKAWAHSTGFHAWWTKLDVG